MLLTRIVTIHRQWSYLRLWIDRPGLFGDPAVAWIICNDAPDDPCPPDLRARLAGLGAALIERPFNAGRSGARNHSARAASSTWLDFIDGDDLPLPVDTAWLRGIPPGRLLHFPHLTYSLIDGAAVPGAEPAPVSPFFWDIGLLRRLPVMHCRPAGLMFPSAEFHGLGGFDGRFDTCEDLHLLWKFDRSDIQATAAPFPKQSYRTAGGESCDVETVGFYTQRLLRLAARAESDTAIADRINTQADIQALRAIRALHDGLARHYAASPSRHEGTGRDVTDLFWRARDTFLRECRPGPLRRLREALKLLFRR